MATITNPKTANFKNLSRRYTLLGSLGVALSGCVSMTMEGMGIDQIRSGAQIPEGFKSYILFLGTTYDYSGLMHDETAIKELSRQFKSFGDAIGSGSLAVFVGDPKAATLDVPSGRTFLDWVNSQYPSATKAVYQDGPFIVVLSRRPYDKPQPTDTAGIIGFRGKSLPDIQNVLTELQNEIGAARKKQPASPFTEILQGIQAMWHQSGKPLAGELAITIATAKAS